MSKALLVLSEGGIVTKIGDQASSVPDKEFKVNCIVESDGSVVLVLLADDGEMIELSIAQKTGEEYWKDIQSAVDGFVESAGIKLSEIIADLSSDAQRIGNAIGQLNLTNHAKNLFSEVFGGNSKSKKQ